MNHLKLVRKNEGIEIFRASGRPVDLAEYDLYAIQWRQFYDIASGRAKLDMQKLHRYLSYGEYKLQQSFKTHVYCADFDDCQALMEKLSLNMLLGVSSDTGLLIGILQDT